MHMRIVENNQNIFSRHLCTKLPEEKDEKETITKGGFARAFEKYTAPTVIEKPVDNETFASLLRHSKFIDVIKKNTLKII